MTNTRSELVNLLPEKSVGCELGVFRGDFSRVLLDSGKFKLLYLVDPFQGEIESGDKDGWNIEKYNGDFLYDMVDREFNSSTCQVVRKDSLSFLRNQPDSFFDFIYVDTNHQYEQTVKELDLALFKIKSGGFICGHDYSAEHFFGVFQAVNEFAEKTGLELQTTTDDRLASYFFKVC